MSQRRQCRIGAVVATLLVNAVVLSSLVAGFGHPSIFQSQVPDVVDAGGRGFAVVEERQVASLPPDVCLADYAHPYLNPVFGTLDQRGVCIPEWVQWAGIYYRLSILGGPYDDQSGTSS